VSVFYIPPSISKLDVTCAWVQAVIQKLKWHAVRGSSKLLPSAPLDVVLVTRSIAKTCHKNRYRVTLSIRNCGDIFDGCVWLEEFSSGWIVAGSERWSELGAGKAFLKRDPHKLKFAVQGPVPAVTLSYELEGIRPECLGRWRATTGQAGLF